MYHAIVAQLVERHLAKVETAGSSPVYRFLFTAEFHKMWGSAVFAICLLTAASMLRGILRAVYFNLPRFHTFEGWAFGVGLRKSRRCKAAPLKGNRGQK